MNIVKLSAALSLLVRGVDGTCQCKDVCAEYERKGPKCWVVQTRDWTKGCPPRFRKCENKVNYEWDDPLFGECHKKSLCQAGDWGACVNEGDTWCPGMCRCNILGCSCDPCAVCRSAWDLTEGLVDVPDSEDDYNWYMGLSPQDKLAHLNEVVCQKHGYGDATSFDFIKAVEDHTDENLIDDDEKNNNDAATKYNIKDRASTRGYNKTVRIHRVHYQV